MGFVLIGVSVLGLLTVAYIVVLLIKDAKKNKTKRR